MSADDLDRAIGEQNLLADQRDASSKRSSARDLRREAWRCAALILANGTPVPDALVDVSEPEFKRFDAQWQAVVRHARKLAGER